MDYNGSVMKRVALFLIVAGAAVAMVACQGAVGKTGDSGPKGDPGDPAPPAPPVNLAPIARTTSWDPVTLREGDDPYIIDVEANFVDPEKQTLAFTASVSATPEGAVEAVLAAGDLTVTAVAAGKAIITVTASDGNESAEARLNVKVIDAGAPELVGVIEGTALTYGDEHVISGTKIVSAFEGEGLSFSAERSGGDNVVFVHMADDNTVTIIARGDDGDAEVTITATDEDGESYPHTIKILVRETIVPKASGTPDAVTLVVGGEPEVVDVSMYFSDPMVGDVTYTAMSDNDAVATAARDGSMVTITPEGRGSAMVEVTAANKYSDEDEPAVQTIMVTVDATKPTAVGTIPDQTLSIGDQRNIGLDRYFRSAEHGSSVLTYTSSVDSDPTDAVSARVSGNDLIIDAHMEGSATITVTAADGEDETAEQTFMVTVQEEEIVQPQPENVAPRMKPDKMLSTFKRETNNSAAPESFNLDDYFEDSDGNDALITYEVKQDKKKEKPDTANESVIAVGGAMWQVAADGTTANCEEGGTDTADGIGAAAVPDGKDVGDDILKICYENAGTAEIEITAIDFEGVRSETATVIITVSDDNSPPAVAVSTITDAVTGELPDHNGAASSATARLTIDKRLDVIKDAEFNKYFSDPDLNFRGDADMLTFDVVFLTVEPSDGLHATITEVLAGNTVIKEDNDGYGAVEHEMTPKIWNGDPKAKFTLGLIGRKGTATKASDGTVTQVSQIVAIVATDTYGQKFARYFSVGVNHSPMAEGDQAAEADKKTLSGETDMFKDLVVPLADVGDDTRLTSTNSTATVPLVVSAGGYFSDGDGAGDLADGTAGTGAGCVIKNTDGPADVARFEISETADTVSLHILARKIGTRTVTIACRDTFGVESPSDILTVEVIGSVRGSRQ